MWFPVELACSLCGFPHLHKQTGEARPRLQRLRTPLDRTSSFWQWRDVIWVKKKIALIWASMATQLRGLSYNGPRCSSGLLQSRCAAVTKNHCECPNEVRKPVINRHPAMKWAVRCISLSFNKVRYRWDKQSWSCYRESQSKTAVTCLQQRENMETDFSEQITPAGDSRGSQGSTRFHAL